jgi:hypothetical protein
LCASEPANSSALSRGQLSEHEKKLAGRRAVEMIYRREKREDHEKVEVTAKRLQGLYLSAIAEYLSYAPKQM